MTCFININIWRIPLIILTGGAGFIGSAFLWRLNQEGWEDVVVVDKLSTDDKWKNLQKKTFIDYIDKDKFLDLMELNKFKNIKTIIHMGACSSTIEKDADFMMSNNYNYSIRIAQWCAEKNVRLIYASSGATYGDGNMGYNDDYQTMLKLKPLNIYGYSKHLFDIWVYKNGLFNTFTGFKFFNVFGPNEYHKGDMMSVVCKAYEQINKTGCLKLFKSYKQEYAHGEQRRDFVYIKDVIDVMYYFFQNKKTNGLFNLGTGKARTWNDLAKACFKAMNKKLKIKYIPMPLTLRDRYQYFTEANIVKLKGAGYTGNFHTLEDAVSDYIKSYLLQEDPYL